jgi:hypothetical protein
MTKHESFFLLQRIAIDKFVTDVSYAKLDCNIKREADLRWNAYVKFGREIANFDAIQN